MNWDVIFKRAAFFIFTTTKTSNLMRLDIIANNFIEGRITILVSYERGFKFYFR
jgi:hypothetical protein